MQLPVLIKPGSNVMRPVLLRNCDISMAFSPKVPSVTGNSYEFPSKINFAVFSMAYLQNYDLGGGGCLSNNF